LGLGERGKKRPAQTEGGGVEHATVVKSSGEGGKVGRGIKKQKKRPGDGKERAPKPPKKRKVGEKPKAE